MPAIVIAAQHPLTRAVASMLASRGDPEGVALARGLAIVEMLIADGWIDRQTALKDSRAARTALRAAKREQRAPQYAGGHSTSYTPDMAQSKSGRK